MMVLVTGANGLLGSYICRELLTKDVNFRALVRSGADKGLLEDIIGQLTIVEGDILDVVRMEKELVGVTHIIHAAAVVSHHSEDVKMMFKANVEGTRNMVNLALKLGIERFVHVSSVAALGRDRNSLEIDETSEWVDSPMNTTYAKTKYLSEIEVWRAHAEGLRTTILNPSLILGPGDWNKSSTQVFRYVWEERKYYSSGMANCVDVRDVASIAVLALNGTKSGERYIVNAESLPYRSLLERIAHRFEKRPPYKPVTPLLMTMAILAAKIQSFFSGKKPMITREAVRSGQYHFEYNSDKVKESFSFRFRVLEDTLSWTVTQLLAQKPK